MDIFHEMVQSKQIRTIRSIDMHTIGEPTRIVIDGYPKLEGSTLLEKRQFVRKHLDHIRKQIMNEPRGHFDMYGAILVQETEMTETGEADIGVLFCHNEGYSTMCGHATIALGRFLIDTEDHALFPRRPTLPYNEKEETVELRLHAPCGIVHVKVPVLPRDMSSGASFESISSFAPETAVSTGKISDPSRMVSFLSVPSFVVKKDMHVSIPSTYAWPELVEREASETEGDDVCYPIVLDLAFGGAFYAIVEAKQLGFKTDESGRVDFDRKSIKALEFATHQIKYLLGSQIDNILLPYRHLVEKDLQFLYGVTVVDSYVRAEMDRGATHADRNLCFFAESQLDRSPTGSCVAARTALAASKGELKAGECWEFNSIVSQPSMMRTTFPSPSPERFIGTLTHTHLPVRLDIADEHVSEARDSMSYIVQVEGFAWYTGAHTFILEEGDTIGKGFLLGQ